MKEPSERYEVSVEFDGHTYTAPYFIESNIVSVKPAMYSPKATQIGGSPVEVVARMLFVNILQEAKSRGELKP